MVETELALIHCELGEAAEALAHLRQSQPEMIRDPRLSVYWEAVAAVVYVGLGDREPSMSYIASVEDRRHQFSEDVSLQRYALFYTARAASMLGDHIQAESLLHAYLELNPDAVYLPTAYYGLADCLRARGDLEGSREYDRRASSTRMGTLHERLARERLAREW